jgi:hypothetical protein
MPLVRRILRAFLAAAGAVGAAIALPTPVTPYSTSSPFAYHLPR